jgi:dihydrodipicolinate synthase/N-acetylneuraminate lyase
MDLERCGHLATTPGVSAGMHNRMKTALRRPGRLPHPTVRPPLLPLPPDEVSAIAAALAAAGLGGREASVRG